MPDVSEFTAIMADVANEVMTPIAGPFNKSMSNSKERRWGEKGAFSVDLQKGVWRDHSDNTGGGVLDLLAVYAGLSKPAALAWLAERGHLKRNTDNRSSSGSNDGQQIDKFAGFMDDHPVAIFKYYDDKGGLAYEVLKFAKTAPRRYMQRRPHPAGKGWIWGLQEGKYGQTRSGDWFKFKDDKKYEATEEFEDARWFLYHRAEVVKAVSEGRPIILVEGEKDVETLRTWGLTATTNQGGAKNWKPELDGDLKGADVVICSDLDKAGNARTLMRGAALRSVAKSVRVLDMANHWKDAPDKADVTDWKEQAGGTGKVFEEFVATAPAWKPERPKSRFGAIPWSDRQRKQKRLEFLVDGWLTETGVTFLGGPSGSGKSFLALHIAMCVSRGVDFFDRPVKHRGVIYQAGEGGVGLLDRMDAFAKHFQVSDEEEIPFELLPAKIDIFSKDSRDTENLIQEIKALALGMAVPVGLVVIDTLSKATVGADEINGKDTAAILANVERIRDECNVNVIVVHHMNADGKKLRGHTSLRDNADTVILITNDKETGIRDAILDKQKDAEDGLRLKFSLGAVAVRVNEVTGSDVTSCVVLSVSEKERLKAEQARIGYGPSQTERRILLNYFDTVDRHGRLVTSEKEGPRAALGKVVVNYLDYQAVALEKLIEVEDKAKAVDQIRKEFSRAKDGLARYGILEMHKPFVWWTGKPIRGFPRTFKKRDDELDVGQNSISPGLQEIMTSGSDYEILL
ncbi:AAA family ATPase [Mesorhizobium sp. NBSH29]|uniref:AAA family ATPase n=1 Tax=Mesorhizobium sp. NBSH29 TaxID=2654249 RepID=UPI001896826D|nr:AAA family ATPase [Mesorhizobium sp. NBSH29]QPC87099.1 AAA family ATPase [Mesorhizobium sp. NBSH29]